MRRGEIHEAFKELEAMVAIDRFALPPDCQFTTED